MKLSIVLVFAWPILRVHSRCYHPLGSHDRNEYHHQYANYECAPDYRCYDQYYNLSHEERLVIQSASCYIYAHICCRHLDPPPLSSATQPRPHSVSHQFPWREPLRNTLPSRPRPGGHMNRLPKPGPPNAFHLSPGSWGPPSWRPSANPEPEPPSSPHIFPNGPIWESSPNYEPPSLSHISPSSLNCQCKPSYECNDKIIRDDVYIPGGDQSYIRFRQKRCPAPSDVCCYDLAKPLSQHSQDSSQIDSQAPIRIPSLQPLKPISSPSSIQECRCTPFFSCYDEETSSNLTSVVDDRINIHISQESKPNVCPNPNDICCYNLDQPSSTPTSNQLLQPQPPGPSQPFLQTPDQILPAQPQAPSPSQPSQLNPTANSLTETQPHIASQTFSSLNGECTCISFFRCYDEETSSNLTGVVNDRIMNQGIAEKQASQPGACPDSLDVCCHNLNPPITKQTAGSTGGANHPFGVIWPES